MIKEERDVNKVFRFEAQKEKDEPGQLLKEAEDEIDSLALRNNNLTKKICTFSGVKEKGSPHQDKDEKEEDLNICHMAVKCNVEAIGRGKQDFQKEFLEPPFYCAEIKRTEGQCMREDFLKIRTFWEVKEKGKLHQDKLNLKKEDVSISNEILLKSLACEE